MLPVLSSLDSSAPNINAHRRRRTAFLGKGTREGIGWDGSGLRRVYSILLLSPQVLAHCCCPSLRILVVYICARDTFVHYHRLTGWRSVGMQANDGQYHEGEPAGIHAPLRKASVTNGAAAPETRRVPAPG